MVEAELLKPANRELLTVCTDAASALSHLRVAEPGYVEKWIDADER